MTEGAVQVSVIVPCFDEEGAAAGLAREIAAALRPTGRPFEIVFVDDRSTDRTLEILRAVQADVPELRIVRHRANYGQSAAVASGFRVARGVYLATLDGDGQNDPADLPAMIERLESQGADAVTGVRARRHDSALRRIASRFGNAFRDLVTGVRVSDAGCGIRVLRREAAAELVVFNGMHRFVPTMLALQGYRVEEVEVSHRPRTSGRSKYGILDRGLRGLLDCLAMRWYRRRVVPGRRIEQVEEPPCAS